MSAAPTCPRAFQACALLLLVLEAAVTVRALRDASGAVGPRIDEEDAEPLLDAARLDTARCRAECLLQCWQTCKLIMADFLTWGPMCQEEGICYPGCQVACTFRNKSKGDLLPSSRGRPTPGTFSASPRIDAVKKEFLVTWPIPRAADSTDGIPPLVYTLAGKEYKSASWEEVHQTQRRRASVSQYRLVNSLELRVLAVSPSGVWAVSPEVRLPRLTSVSSTMADVGERLKSGGMPEARVLLPWPPPRLLAFRRSADRGLEAHIAWQANLHQDAVAGSAFEVTWRLMDAAMELTGRLYTSQTEAALPVLPVSSYTIFVRRLDPEGQPVRTSGSLVIDTGAADTETRLLPRMTGRCVRVEGIAACMASVSVLAIVFVACLICRKSRHSSRSQTGSKKLSSTHEFKDFRQSCVPATSCGHEKTSGFPSGCNATVLVASAGSSKEAGSPDDGTYFVFDLRSS